MDAVLLARIQFALTVGFHYIFPPLTIGLAWIIVWLLGHQLRTGEELHRRMARFWIRIFALSFAMGVATGITMEFQFGMNWADYSRFVGDIFGAPLAAEGVIAFFLESSFLGVLLFGERRVSDRVYLFSAVMVAVGSTLSAFWIIVANSWQQTPAGYRIVEGRAELVDFFAALFNPSTIPRFFHTMDGALVTGAFFVTGVSALFLLRGQHRRFAERSLATGVVAAFLASALIFPLGHVHSVQVSVTQPAKLAVIEGLWETQSNAPLLLFGIPNREKQRTDLAVELPGALSIGVGGSTDTVVLGLKEFPEDEWPPLFLSFFSFHLMVGLGCYFIGFATLGAFLLWRKKLYQNRLFLRLAVLSVPLPFISNECGWIAAEVGRQPWIVYGLMRTRDAISVSVPAWQIAVSIAVFCLLYTVLFCFWIFLLKRKLDKGPEADPEAGGEEVAT